MRRGRPADMPESPIVRDALVHVADVLGVDICWLHNRRYHFVVDGPHTVAVSPDSAGRLRLEACRYTRTTATLWALPTDSARLAEAVRELATTDGVGVGA